MRVTLTEHEMRVAALVGSERRLRSFNLPDNHGFDGTDGWTIDIEAAAGEMAFCKLFRRYWACDVNTFKSADVGRATQIRTVSDPAHCLIVRPTDDPDHLYALMVGVAPTFEFAGWITGNEARDDKWWRAPNGRPGAWFVPRHGLQTRTSLNP